MNNMNKEEQEYLILESKMRYPIGTHFECVNGNTSESPMIITDKYKHTYLDSTGPGIHFGNYWLYLKGKWAVITKYAQDTIITNYDIF